MFHSVSLLSQAPLACGSCALPSVLYYQVIQCLCGVVMYLGPCPDWDPEVVEALENSELAGGDQMELEDDFVMLVSGTVMFV